MIAHLKYYVNGKKLYLPVVRYLNICRNFSTSKYLRRHFKTATEADDYARRVMARYKRLLAARVE